MSSTVAGSVFQFPWREVFTPIVGLMGAFGGAFLANYFADKRWQKQVEHEAQKDSVKVIREKGEELYTLCCRWEKMLFLIQMAQIRYIKSNREWNGFKEYIESVSLGPGVYDRLESLLHIYFYELTPRLGMIRGEMGKCNNVFDNFKKGLMTNIDESTKIINQSSIELEEHTLIMKEYIRTKLKI
jgi:hypothetical protein